MSIPCSSPTLVTSAGVCLVEMRSGLVLFEHAHHNHQLPSKLKRAVHCCTSQPASVGKERVNIGAAKHCAANDRGGGCACCAHHLKRFLRQFVPAVRLAHHHSKTSVGRIVGALKLLDRPLKPSHEKKPQREAMRNDYNVVRRAHVVAPERPDK
jgi:hypothetical protein